MQKMDLTAHFKDYSKRFADLLARMDWSASELLAQELLLCWKTGRQVFLAGNGGSAGNANHIANDFLYPISKALGSGIRMHSLSENPAVLTCLANDEGYAHVYRYQLAVQAQAGDVLVVFSGSGNSPNILNVLHEARDRGVRSFAILGYDGGQAKAIADVAIHFPINDMQIAEDMQTMLFHMIVQWLYAQRNTI
jgi:D-sedoheptulose 7-phosphate isomerase